MNVVITNHYEGKRVTSHARIKVLARFVMEEEQWNGSVGIVLVGKDSMAGLNHEYMGRDGETDVLAFHYGAGERGIEGEVVVSVDRAKEEAQRRGLAEDRELFLYVIHGILHLCGYEDGSDRERRRMQKREKMLLERFIQNMVRSAKSGSHNRNGESKTG